MPKLLLQDRTVVVTGAVRGLGAAIAEACAHHGATVILTDLLADEVAATAESLGANASAQVHDVADPASWQQLETHLRATIGRPDALVNNAGIVRGASLAEATLADLRRTLDVNVGGTFLGIKTYLQLHEECGAASPGSIVNIASVRGLIGGARSVTHSASKFGVRGFDKGGSGRTRASRHPRQRNLSRADRERHEHRQPTIRDDGLGFLCP